MSLKMGDEVSPIKTAHLVSHTNFCASNLISTQLLRRAKRGARGKAATKMVMKPNWRTEIGNIEFVDHD